MPYNKIHLLKKVLRESYLFSSCRLLMTFLLQSLDRKRTVSDNTLSRICSIQCRKEMPRYLASCGFRSAVGAGEEQGIELVTREMLGNAENEGNVARAVQQPGSAKATAIPPNITAWRKRSWHSIS